MIPACSWCTRGCGPFKTCVVLDQEGKRPIGLTFTDCLFNGEGHACSLWSASVVVSDEGVDSSRFSIAHAIPAGRSIRLYEYMDWDALHVINQWHTWEVRPCLRGYWQLLCACHAFPRVSQADTLYQTSVIDYNKAVSLPCFTDLQRSLC